ncbi:transcriptional regulator family: Fungal Specific TF [Penicillium roqueforti]|uniref:transcriptional regulator family: Fungal Specific TF n=1 Tax=Penicillium roqueforti TaxID=5082 RepID=UPI00190A1E6D|nr:transcriptional regulator family: Fungal Specific TF [Penicillium roqueforti]KAF9249328.1 transcriptional regulator family: Fungal Specific TF [Penicillium roqueforti]KAI2674950.1 transcriptional regulator family: Fungal Specific TF [Penicillium roqueforti]KAI2688208.1 transcriptional regulator family: Fungal Specific TF [Penicillium roqueforti]KAI2699781.1 transcriptional regulator family: Fungal Specific TF [Penicillium roqueforti]KAI2719734.1 transcriptional regulator family: Fungal Spec
MESQGDQPSPAPDSVEVELPNGKRRWRRNRVACDSCHTRRVRCDRAFPCSRCLRGDIHCQFTRERRKRGRIARSKPTNGNTNAEDEVTQDRAEGKQADGEHKRESKSQSQSQQRLSPIENNSPTSTFHQPSPATNEISAGVDDPRSMPDCPQPQRTGPAANVTEEWLSAAHLSPDSYDMLAGTGGSDAPLPRLMDIWNPVDFAGHQAAQHAPPLPSVSGTNPSRRRRSSISRSPLKYPVLEPLMPFLESHLPRRLVCDLLELYFTSAFSTHMHPVCHHIHCYVLRKTSFLSVDRPRPTSPALLASMLWVAAVDDRAFSLSISPLQRRKICQFLCALIIRLLRPLIHVSFKDQDSSPAENTTTHDFSAGTHHPFEGVGDDKGLVGPAGSLDDVITYIHVASIISSSEQKAASMRWWHAAFTLARELKLNQEMEITPNIDSMSDGSSPSFGYGLGGWPGSPEEHREERRRTWWLLYIMDRHLALCYNRPLALLDAESEDLLLPLDESSWQAGIIHSNSPRPDGPQCLRSGDQNKRRIFPNFICHDHSILGFFLPLMTITGELIDLNQARNHPTLGVRLQGKEAWEVHVSEVLRQLEIYKASLTTFAAAAADPAASSTTAYTNKPEPVDPQLSEAYSWHTQTVIAYSSYLTHVLHILLVGKWDPVSLIEDKDFWTSSPAFASTISHALEAADSVQQILRFDPDVSFMPYFFGIQLLQGSFLLLLIVERLQKEAGEGILNACETMIRATESCVVTLNTEYQRSFRQVMRSAVAQARGRPVNPSEIRHRRKAVLALYRWTRKGTGLAL